MSDKAENANHREVSESSRTERRASEVGKTEVDKELPAWMEKKQQADEQFKAAGLLDKPRDSFVSGTIGRLQIEGDNGEILVKGIPSKGQERQEAPVDTPSELGLKALGENDPRAQAMYEVRKGIKAHMPEGEARDHALTIAKRTENELFQSYEPPDEMMTASDSLVAITPDMVASGDYLEGQVTRVADQENKPIGWLEAAQKIAQLPFDKQLQVIGAGLGAGFNEYNRQQSERSIGALIGTVQGVGTIATNLGKVADFSAYLLLNDHERAGQMGAEFGEALGSSIVGGFRLFEGAHRYLNDVGKAGYQGDYTKVFRDIDNLGKQMDKAWSELPPREQSRIISKLGTELAADGLIGLGAAKAAGKLPGQITRILDTISTDAQRLHLAGKNLSDRSVRAIKEAVGDFLQPEVVTPDGQRIKLGKLNRPRSDKPDTSMLMSQTDDVSGSGSLVGRGMDAAGKALKFNEESGIELVESIGKNPDSIWKKGWSIRGFEGEGEMGSTGILSKNFPRIDDAIYKDGSFPSMKTIDLSSPYYRDKPNEVFRKLDGYLDKINKWNGQEKPWGGHKIDADEIEQKILHIGIPNGAITDEQKQAFEEVGKRAKSLGIKMRVTVIK